MKASITKETHFKEAIIQELDSLSLKVDDLLLAETIDTRITKAKQFWDGEDVRLTERQNKIESYLTGNQIDKKDLHPSQRIHMENVLWEAWIRNRSILMSRMPDIIVSAGDSQTSKRTEEVVSEIIDNDVKKERNASVLAMAVMQRPIYFYSVIKAVWNKERDDYEFVNVHPQNIILDNSVQEFEKSRFIVELVETTVEEVAMRFPDKKKEFFEAVSLAKNWDKVDTRSKLATTITITETWFKEYMPVTDDFGESKWELVTGVAWKYKDIILGKMKHPYWDWKGKSRYFKMNEEEREELTQEEIYGLLFEDADRNDVAAETTFSNYLSEPEFPYYVMTINRNGKHQIDITTNFEQILHFQDSINRQGIQINEMNARSVGKDVYSINAFDSEDDIEKIDPKDLSQAVKVRGEDINKVYSHIDYDPAPQQLYVSKREDRSIAFEMLALNATTRGTRETGDETLGARQMMREQDFGVLDYEVSRTITPAAQWMARWMLQFIKRYYKTPHYRKVVGDEGEKIRMAITNDLIMDGMEVEVSASSVDKMKRFRQAQMDAQAGLIDPLTYFEDTEQSDPKERAMRLMMFKMSPEMYVQQFINDRNVQEQVQALQAMPPEQQMNTVGAGQGAPVGDESGSPMIQ